MPVLSRQELYDLVWSTPMQKLAESFGLSDVGLAKICDRHRVPTPPRGYWAKKEAGKPVKQTIFVQVDDPLLDRVTIESTQDKLPPPVREIIEQRRAERKASNPQRPRSGMVSPPSEPVSDPHPAIRATAKALRGAKPSAQGTVQAICPDLCGISVGTKSIERIIAFLDRLVRACDARGMRFLTKERQMAVVVDKDDVTFEITEKTKQVPHVLTGAEIAAEEKRRKRNEQLARGRPYWSDAIDLSPLPPKFDTVRTGKFGLRVFGWGDGLRWTWNDGKTQTLETLLEEIVDGFETHIATARIRREKQERVEAERRELERRHALAKARRERESERKRLLSRFIRAKRRIAQLSEWIHAYETTADSDLERMVEWARSELTTLETKLDPNIVAVELSTRKLFPKIDELLDPLGEPPPVRYW